VVSAAALSPKTARNAIFAGEELAIRNRFFLGMAAAHGWVGKFLSHLVAARNLRSYATAGVPQLHRLGFIGILMTPATTVKACLFFQVEITVN
jgi:hypothetical protein